MTIGHPQQTATILPFRHPRGSSAQGSALAGKAEVDAKGQRPPAMAFQDSWYHQAAIEDAARSRKP